MKRKYQNQANTSSTGASGATITFTGLECGSYILTVTAVSQETAEEVETTVRVYVPEAANECTVNLINHGVTISGSNASIEFGVAGVYTYLECTLDNTRVLSQPCKCLRYN